MARHRARLQSLPGEAGPQLEHAAVRALLNVAEATAALEVAVRVGGLSAEQAAPARAWRSRLGQRLTYARRDRLEHAVHRRGRARPARWRGRARPRAGPNAVATSITPVRLWAVRGVWAPRRCGFVHDVSVGDVAGTP